MGNIALSSSGQFTGHRGGGNINSFDSDTGQIVIAQGTGVLTIDDYDKSQERTIWVFNDDTNRKGIAFGYLGYEVSESDGVYTYQMESMIDKNGEICYFIDSAGDPHNSFITSGNQRNVARISCTPFDWFETSTLEAQLTAANLSYDEGANEWSFSNSNNLALGAGGSGDQSELVMHWSNTNYSRTSPDNQRIYPREGSITMGKLLDYRRNEVTNPVNVTSTVTATFDDDLFNWVATQNSGTVKSSNILVFGGNWFSNKGRCRMFGGTETQQAGHDPGMSLMMSLNTNIDIVSGRDGSPFTAVSGQLGGKDYNVARNINCFSSGQQSISFRWLGVSSDIRIKQPNTGYTTDNNGPLSGIGADDTFAQTQNIEFGGASTSYTPCLLIQGDSGLAATSDPTNFLWRANDSNDQYVKIINYCANDRRAIAIGGGAWDESNNDDYHSGWRASFEFAGQWINLPDKTAIYGSYTGEPATPIGSWGDSHNPFAQGYIVTTTRTGVESHLTGTDGTADIKFVETLYYSDSTTETTGDSGDGYWEFTDSAAKQQPTGWTYSVHKFGYHVDKVDVSRVDIPLGGEQVKCLEIRADKTGSLSGNQFSSGENLEEDTNIGNLKQFADRNDTSGLEALDEDQMALMVGAWDSTDEHYFSLEPSAQTGAITFTFDDNHIGTRSRVALDELYGMIHYYYTVPGNSSFGENHYVVPCETIDSNGVWDWTTTNTDSDITSIGLNLDGGNSNGTRFVADGYIKGLKVKNDQTFVWAQSVEFDNGMILESSSTALTASSWTDEVTSLTSPTAGYAFANGVGRAGNFTLKGRVDYDVSATSYNLYFDNSKEDELYLYSDLTDDDSDAQGQIRVNFNSSSDCTLFIHGLRNTINLQDGATKAFHAVNDGSGSVDVEFVADLTITLTDPNYDSTDTTVDANGGDWSVYAVYEDDSKTLLGHSHFENINTSTNTDASEIDYSFTSDNKHEFTITFDPRNNVSFVGVYKQADGRCYEPIVIKDFNSDQIHDLVRIPSITSISAGAQFPTTVEVSALTAAISDTNTVTVVIDYTTNPVVSATDQETRYWMNTIVTANTNILGGIARGYLPVYLFDYGPALVSLHEDLYNTTNNTARFTFELKTGNTTAPWHLLTQLVNAGESTLWNLVTSSTGNKKIFFEPKSEGASIGSISDELDRRNVKTDTWISVSRLKKPTDP